MLLVIQLLFVQISRRGAKDNHIHLNSLFAILSFFSAPPEMYWDKSSSNSQQSTQQAAKFLSRVRFTQLSCCHFYVLLLSKLLLLLTTLAQYWKVLLLFEMLGLFRIALFSSWIRRKQIFNRGGYGCKKKKNDAASPKILQSDLPCESNSSTTGLWVENQWNTWVRFPSLCFW